MEHFIIGTAGHIDHGKTSLIKALTNIDCDTHPEEKKRGITINLGFAYIKRDNGDYMAFVDVPGHHRFISNMVAGATGIDFVMLVVAADDGVMPQTKEHLKICSLLGIKSGIVVINKCDAVSSDEIELCTEEVQEFTEGTFLEGKPIFNVSAHTGEGIKELRDYLLSGSYMVEGRKAHDFFRMSVDRTFNVSGFGAVVTGTVAQHSIAVGDSVMVLPRGISAKVRGIQRHSSQVDVAHQGTRVAIDLTGVKLEDITMGDILCENQAHATQRFDAELTMMEDSDTSLNKFDAIMLVGTAKMSVKVKIISYFTKDKDLCAYAQLDLPRDWFFSLGDSFILRNSSSDHTIAGGRVIDPVSLNHKKMSDTLKENLALLSASELSYIETKVVNSITILDTDSFVPILQTTNTKICDMLSVSDKVTLFSNGKLLPTNKLNEFKSLLLAGFSKYVKTNPLSVIGVARKKLIQFVGDYQMYKDPKVNDEAVGLALDVLEKEGDMQRNGNQWRMKGMRVELSPTEKLNIQKVEQIIASYEYNSFNLDDIFADAYSKGIDNKSCKYIITYLTDIKRIVRLNEMFFWANGLAKARTVLVNYLKDHKTEGIKTATYRDLMGVNRKVAVMLLEAFDKEKIVIRREDVRFLIEK